MQPGMSCALANQSDKKWQIRMKKSYTQVKNLCSNEICAQPIRVNQSSQRSRKGELSYIVSDRSRHKTKYIAHSGSLEAMMDVTLCNFKYPSHNAIVLSKEQ